MYVVVRCPRCLLTIYTAFQFDGKKDLVVKSLDGESLPFYNCPLAICGYHFNTNHDVNLYSNTPIGHKRYVSYGFTIAPRTAETRPFRSKEQVAALAITLDTPQDVPQKPTVREAQVGDKAQAAKDPGQGDGKGDTSVPAVAPANKSARFMKWTVSEMEKLKRLANEGLSLDAIAQEMERSASAVKNKIKMAAMHDKGQLPDVVQATPLKRKRDSKEADDRPISNPYQGGSMDRI